MMVRGSYIDTFMTAVLFAAGQVQLSIFNILGRGRNSHGGEEQNEDCRKTHTAFDSLIEKEQVT